MSASPTDAGVRLLQGAGALGRVGEEAAALGARALLVSAAQPEGREAALLDGLRRSLQAARVGHQSFPRVPRPTAPQDRARDLASEAAREGHCRLVVGVGDGHVLEVARAAAAAAWLPCLAVPTVVGYGRPAASDEFPLPDVLLLDPRAGAGSPPRRTAAQGVALLSGLLEAYATAEAGPPDRPLEEAMRALVLDLPRAVRSPDAAAPREGIAQATGIVAEAMAHRGTVPAPLEALVLRLAGRGVDPESGRAALLPAALEVAASRDMPLPAGRVAGFGRAVLGIREPDAGRAAVWAAGGVRQWLRNLGCVTRLTVGGSPEDAADEIFREILAVMRR